MNQIEEIAKWQKERCLDKTGYDLDGANYRFMEEIFEMNGFEGTLAKKLATSYSMYIKQERQAMGYVPTEHQIVDASPMTHRFQHLLIKISFFFIFQPGAQREDSKKLRCCAKDNTY